LVDLAAEMKVAMIAIMHFNKKLDVTNALLRISDSLAFGRYRRHVFAAADDPENKRKLFVRGKNNLARSDIQALAYNFDSKEVAPDIWAPHIVWHEEHVAAAKGPPPATTPKNSSKNFSLGGRSRSPISWIPQRPT
jgi:hypothetical protein